MGQPPREDETIGQRVKRLRLERGLSATLPDAMTLNKLARWLGVPVSQLLQAAGHVGVERHRGAIRGHR